MFSIPAGLQARYMEVDDKEKEGKTPLFEATFGNNSLLSYLRCKDLIESGNDINKISKINQRNNLFTPLDSVLNESDQINYPLINLFLLSGGKFCQPITPLYIKNSTFSISLLYQKSKLIFLDLTGKNSIFKPLPKEISFYILILKAKSDNEEIAPLYGII